jgi:hypothetical protein
VREVQDSLLQGGGNHIVVLEDREVALEIWHLGKQRVDSLWRV